MDLRITDIEVKLSHCEDAIDALNRTVFRQQQQMDLLQAQLRELFRMAQAVGAAESRSLRDEIPPHY